MSNYVLSSCSTADLTSTHFEDRDIKFICFHYALNDKEYLDDLGKSMPIKEFYAELRNGADSRTWQVNSEEYKEYFEQFLKEGKDLLHLTLSSGISGSYNSAIMAKKELEDKYPERKIYVIDSLAASSGLGLFMDKLADLRDEGKTIDEVADFAMQNRLKMHHWFISSDLTFYIKGGRISKTSGVVGTLLGICPLLNVSNEGKLVPRAKIRTKKKALIELVNKMAEHAEGSLDYSGKCYICNSDCLEDAETVASLIRDKFQNIDGDVEIYDIGTTIGSHSGPGTVAVFFWGDERID